MILRDRGERCFPEFVVLIVFIPLLLGAMIVPQTWSYCLDFLGQSVSKGLTVEVSISS
jgi:hypothetical protein